MARFGANVSDESSSEDEDIQVDEPLQKPVDVTEEYSEEETEEDESYEDEESSGSSSQSDLELDDLQRDDSEEEDDEDEEYDEEEMSPPPVAKTMIPQAAAVGIDSQRMHVMQSSLFRMPEEAAALRSLNQPRAGLNRKHSRDSDGDGFRVPPRERASFAYDIDPPIHRPTRKYTRIQSSTSAFAGNEHAAVDAGLALGCSFRVGWGPGGLLAHFGSLVRPTGKPPQSSSPSTVHITSIKTFSTPTNLSMKLLQHHLSNSPIEPDDDGVPAATPSPTFLNFSSFASLFAATDFSAEANLFRLGEALFDPVELRLADTITPDIRNRILPLVRRTALSSWLSRTTAPSVDAEVRAAPSSDPLLPAFTLLTGNQVEKACNVAMQAGYPKLATLVAQAGGDFDFKEDLADQLAIWRDQRVDAHIDDTVRRIYTLLAGKVDGPLEGSNGIEPERCKDVDVVENLDWKRVFGLCLWYSEPLDASIAHVFRTYTDLTTNTLGRKVARPLPWYVEQQLQRYTSPPPWKLPPENKLPPDALYSLIRLFSDPVCSLSHILNPLSFSSSPLDYSLAWHLYIILSRCLRVRDFMDRGDPGISKDDDDTNTDDGSWTFEGHSPTADLLTSTYAFQLEQLGMIQEALFVLLHIEGSLGREKAIKNLLARSAPLFDEWTIRGVVGSLKIPMSWLHEAQALYAVHKGEMYEAYELYIKAGMHNLAHDIAIQHLAAEAVIRHDHEVLETLFYRFVGRHVDGWHVRGKIFMDYVDIITRLPELVADQELNLEPDATQIAQIEDLTRAIPKVLGLLPDIFSDRLDIRHKVALSEMTAALVKMSDRMKPLGLASHTKMPLVDEVAKLHLQSTAVARFLKSISSQATS